jgi:hypothetical protein
LSDPAIVEQAAVFADDVEVVQRPERVILPRDKA